MTASTLPLAPVNDRRSCFERFRTRRLTRQKGETVTGATAVEPPRTDSDAGPGLRRRCLGFTEVLGQSVANDGPSLAIATGAALVATSATGGTTWVFVIATVAIILVALNLVALARRLASAGSLYEYARQGLGNLGGFVVGWAQLLGYVCGAMFSLVAVWVYLTALLGDSKVNVSAARWGVLTIIVAGLLAGLLAFRSIRLSTRLELLLEVASVAVILILSVVILVKNGANFDHAQLKATGTDFHGMALGFPLAILSFVGFESSASLGVEARRPFSTIPRSIMSTAVGIGIFFVLVSYVQVLGFDRHGKNIASSSAPLNDLATVYGVGTLGQVVSAGIVVSAFGIALACLNAASRVALTMSKDGMLPPVFGRTHPVHRTPSLNVMAGTLIAVAVPAAMVAAHKDPGHLLEYYGEYTALGLLVAYLGVCIAAPLFLRRVGALTLAGVVVGALGAIASGGMLLGQIYPIPPNPVDLLLVGFAIWLVLGVVIFAVRGASSNGRLISAGSTTDENTAHSLARS